jgi:hypothetical protein
MHNFVNRLRMKLGLISPSTVRRCATAGILLAGTPGVAAPVALVEEITGQPPGLELFDYLDSGRVFQLKPGDVIVIGYFGSCVRERVRGGTVTIGTKRSDVKAGEVDRTMVRCDSGKILQPPSDFVGTIVRSERTGPAPKPTVQLVIHGNAPVIEVRPPGVLLIERIDKHSERQVIDTGREGLSRGRFYDFADHGKALATQGIYLASFGDKELVFKIDAHAGQGHSPIIGRLIRLVPPD